jgi:phosphatidylinositol glycan class S
MVADGSSTDTILARYPRSRQFDHSNSSMASPTGADASLAFESDQAATASSRKPLDVVRATKQPPPESAKSVWLRRFAIISFWAVVVLLGLPIWLKTTAIYRADLPLQVMSDWAEGKVVF